MENKILVFYIGIYGIDHNQIETYVNMVAKKITPVSFNGEIIIIPIHSYDSRVECINPKYITKKELIKENESLINELNNKLKEQIDIQKNEKN